jgi:hypothetical protein
MLFHLSPRGVNVLLDGRVGLWALRCRQPELQRAEFLV